MYEKVRAETCSTRQKSKQTTLPGASVRLGIRAEGGGVATAHDLAGGTSGALDAIMDAGVDQLL